MRKAVPVKIHHLRAAAADFVRSRLARGKIGPSNPQPYLPLSPTKRCLLSHMSLIVIPCKYPAQPAKATHIGSGITLHIRAKDLKAMYYV
jgi:hypothetical protein